MSNFANSSLHGENLIIIVYWPGSKCSKGYFKSIENRIYREELKESLGMNFVSPFQPEREVESVQFM